MDWFRLYGDMPSDPKIGTLNDAEFRTWIELLCAASKYDQNGDTGLNAETIDWALRRDVTVTLPRLLERELVTVGDNENYFIKAWEKRQYKSDTSAERTRKYREKRKTGAGSTPIGDDVTSQKRHCDAVDTEADTEQIQKKEANASSAPSEKISLDASGKWANVSPALLATWSTAYPALSLEAELSKAAAWIIANPKNKKSNYARFLTNWLSRAQDSARPTPTATPTNRADQRAKWMAAFDEPLQPTQPPMKDMGTIDATCQNRAA